MTIISGIGQKMSFFRVSIAIQLMIGLALLLVRIRMKRGCSIIKGPPRGTDLSWLSENEIRQLEFRSELEACEFYRSCVDSLGFVVRNDEVLKDLDGNIQMRQLVCNKEGSRHKKHLKRTDTIREHRALTRTGCLAKLRVHLDRKTQRWKVVGFVGKHNHELTPSGYKHVVPVNGRMTNADKVEVESLYLSGVRSCNILEAR